MQFRQHIPWVAYLVLCAGLVGVCARRAAAERTLVVRSAELAAAHAAHEALRGRALDAEERVAFEQAWIEERVLVHEAKRRGLDRQDPLIRSAVLGQVTRVVAPEIEDPGEDVLRRYCEEHAGDYASPAHVHLSLVTFPEGVTVPPDHEVRARLDRGERPAAISSSPLVGSSLFDMTRDDLRRLFGSAFAEQVFPLAVGVWAGPVPSTLGSHYVRLAGRAEASPPVFEEVEQYVREDWMEAETRRRLRPLLASLRSRFAVDTSGLGVRVADRERQLERPLSLEERRAVHDRFVEEELLLAHARAEGLDGSPYVRRRLGRKMRFLLRANVPGPSEGELRALYDANPKRFVPPGGEVPIPFERARDQLRAMIVGPSERAVVDARVRELVRRYDIVFED